MGEAGPIAQEAFQVRLKPLGIASFRARGAEPDSVDKRAGRQDQPSPQLWEKMCREMLAMITNSRVFSKLQPAKAGRNFFGILLKSEVVSAEPGLD